MKQRKQPVDRPAVKLMVAGALAVIVAPLINTGLIYLFSLNCPLQDGARVCSFEVGLTNAAYISFLSIAWLVASIALLVIGILAYFTGVRKTK